jgi:aminodeoxychorismate synthase component I
MEQTLDFWVDPETAFLALLADEPVSYWLDGGVDAATGVSYLGAPSPASVTAVAAPGGAVSLTTGNAATSIYPGSVFDLLRDPAGARSSGPAHGFAFGWVGWLGYELGAALVGSPHHRSQLPDAVLIQADRTLVFDHATRSITLRATAASTAASTHPEHWLESTASRLRALVGRPDAEPSPPPPSTARLRHPRADYLAMIRECLDAIGRGDAYQICLTNEIVTDAVDSPLDVYRRLRRANPSHHGGFIRTPEVTVASSSPERFLEISPAGRVRTRPITGTRPRGADEATDRALLQQLATDEKEIAENIMIVDLMRNDLHRIAEPGSVETSELLTIESYRNVHQLVSTVSARLAEGRSWVDAVEACLPGGSMTGAPKHSAMSIIDRLERGPRGPYAGAFGFMGSDGRVDLAMTIRTIVMTDTATSIGVGGGITALSNAEAEFAETLLKAEPLLAAVNTTLARPDGS